MGDVGALLGCHEAVLAGLVSIMEWEACAIATVALNLVRLRPRADIKASPTAAPHFTGAGILVARLLRAGVLRCDWGKSAPICALDLSHTAGATGDAETSRNPGAL